MQRRFSFALTSGLAGCFLCWNSIQTETKVFHVIQEIKTVVGNQQEKKISVILPEELNNHMSDVGLQYVHFNNFLLN